MTARLRAVVLGPRLDLHGGIHGSLLQFPPAGYRYVVRNATHSFFGTGTRRAFSPIRTAHAAECVRLGSGGALVHSSRWPVLGRTRWIAEMDDLGYPLLFGRHGLLASFRESFGRPWNKLLASQIHHRARAMLACYAHPSCRHIVFRTEAALLQASRLTSALGLEREYAPMLGKSVVISPAASAMDPRAANSKWAVTKPMRVLFCGRDFLAKDGPLALRVVQRLLREYPDVHFTHIGNVPASTRERISTSCGRVHFTGVLEGARVLEHMRESHVLFHPSPAESVGMVFLEAAAAGMAVVASKGPRLPHLRELLGPRGFIAVERSGGSDDEAFRGALGKFLEHPNTARIAGLANYQGTLNGSRSVAERNRAWRRVYASALKGAERTCLSEDNVRHFAGPLLGELSAARLSRVIEDHLQSSGSDERTFHLGADAS